MKDPMILIFGMQKPARCFELLHASRIISASHFRQDGGCMFEYPLSNTKTLSSGDEALDKSPEMTIYAEV